MKDEQLCIANESIQQLRNFRDSISKLPFNNTRKQYYSNLLSQYELRMQNENLQLDILKLEIIAKLHQDILTKSSFNEYSVEIAGDAENRLISIYEVLNQRLPQSEGNVHKKIIVSVMNFKFHFQRSDQPRLSLEELLDAVQEMSLWQSFAQQSRSYLKYFYLCLMWQYLHHQDLYTFMEIVNLYTKYLVKIIQKQQKQKIKAQSEQAQVNLIDLLHCYNTFKLIKKQFNLQCILVDETQIYSVLYEVEYSLSQQIIYQYKKMNSKTKDEVMSITKKKLQQNIIYFNQQSIDVHLNMLNSEQKRKQNPQNLALAVFHIKRKPSHDNLSETIKKKESQNLKPINNVFVPRRINQNLHLERRLQMKKQTQPSKWKIESYKNNLFRRSSSIKITSKNKIKNGERRITIANNLEEKPAQPTQKKLLERPTYESCKKQSTNKYEQLQMMICERNRGMSLKINRQDQDNHIHLMSVQKNNINRKRRIPNRRSSAAFTSGNMDQKRASAMQLDRSNGQIYPPLIRCVLNQYMKTFTTYFRYQGIKYTLPLYQYFHNIDKSALFYLKGDIIRFLKIQTKGLTIKIVYTKNQQHINTVQFKLYEDKCQSIKNLFVGKVVEQKLSDFHKLGGNLTYFSFNLKSNNASKPAKLQVSQICYQQQIYTYNVYLTNTVNKNNYKKILQYQQNFIKGVDQDLKIQFQYDKSEYCQNIDKKSRRDQVTLREILNANYQRDICQWLKLNSHKLALKIKKNYNVFTVKHLQHLQTNKKYLFFNSVNTAKFSSRFHIVPCNKELNLKTFVYQVKSCEDIKAKLVKNKQILQQSWTDLILNQSLFKFNSKKYVVVKQPRGFEVFKSQTLVQKVLDLVKGQSPKTRWFLLLNLSQFQGLLAPSLQSCKSTYKLLKPIRNRSIYNAISYVSIKSKKTVHISKQSVETINNSPIRFLKKEGNIITMGKQSFKCINYQYSWYFYLRQKVYYCFKMQNKILSLRIKNSYFIYFRNHSIQEKLQCKQLVFKQFRRLLLLQIRSKWFVVGLMGIVGKAQIVNNQIVMYIEQIEDKYSVHITTTQLYGLSQIKMNHLIFKSKHMIQRVMRIVKYKLQQKMIFRQ